jgi:hypothetical protein
LQASKETHMQAIRILMALIAGVTLATPMALAQTSAPAEMPASQPAPVSVAAVPAVVSAVPVPPARDIRLQYQDQPIALIVRSLCQKMDKPLLGDSNVPGSITFFDSQPYTLDEAFDTINILLAMRGYRLVEDGRFLRLVPVSELASLPVPILHGLADVPPELRDEQMVTMLLPLRFISPAEPAM